MQPGRPGTPFKAVPPTGVLCGIAVLVVEDDVATCEALSAALRQHGAVVVTAGSVREAQRQLSAMHDLPLVLVSDIGLPDADGFTLMRSIRAAGSNMPGIAVSGSADATAARGRAAGFATVLAKPVDLPDLVDRIHALALAA